MTARTQPQVTGTPTWLDFWTADIDGTVRFFDDLIGYEFDEGSPEFGGYRVARRDGRYVFGVGPQMPGGGQDQAALYLATDDVDATLQRAAELGGTVVADPMDIPEHGRMAVLADPAGVPLALWQAAGMVGYEAVDEPGFPCWQDCISGDPEASGAFLRDLFGFTLNPWAPGVMEARLGDDSHFTIGQAPEGTEGHWVSYLLVDDVDATAAKAQSLGASVTLEPTDLPFGRFVHLTTPSGAPFGLFQGNQNADAAAGAV